MARPPVSVYVVHTVLLAAFAGVLAAIVYAGWWVPEGAVAPRALVAPITALAGLTAIVWVMMFAYRNVSVARGIANIDYYKLYGGSCTPPEWVERPARTFANLLEAPVLFYLVCVLMIVTGDFDPIQLTLAWVYVGARAVHAVVYIATNYVPTRMVIYVGSCVVLIVMWARFASA